MDWFHREEFGAFWERGYRNPHISSMGGPSFEVAEILPALPKGGKVLDLGCGEGRNAFFLAQNDCEVTAVDRSSAGIHKLMTAAANYKIPLTGIVQDIVEFPLDEEYDLIMAHGVLYYLENPVWRAILEKAKKQTRPGGYNIFTIFVYNDEYPCVAEIEAARYKNSFRSKELQEFYLDWIELRFDQYVKWDAHPGIPLHYHPIEKLVSQKPSLKVEKKHARELISTGLDISRSAFDSIEMALSQDALKKLLGAPCAIERISIEGPQFNVCRALEKRNDRTITPDYCLELWFYGKSVFYVVNGEVAGKALYSSRPIRVCYEAAEGRNSYIPSIL